MISAKVEFAKDNSKIFYKVLFIEQINSCRKQSLLERLVGRKKFCKLKVQGYLEKLLAVI